jgi:glycosyltransferase involved in cell wall biosynthesis
MTWASAGYDVEVISMGQPGTGELDGLPVWTEDSRRRLAQRLHQRRPDLLFVEGGGGSSLSMFPFARHLWIRSPTVSLRLGGRRLQQLLMRRIDAVSITNPADQLRWRLREGQLVDLPYPVDVEYWRQPVARDPGWWLDRGLDAPTGPVLTYISNVVPGKRQADLVQALDPLLSSRPDVHLVIAGRSFDEQARSALQATIAAATASNRIHYVGEVTHEQARQLYAWTAVHIVHTGLPETQCMVIYESLAAGVPTLISDVATLTSAFPHLPAHGTAEQLRANVSMLLSDPKMAQTAVDMSVGRVAWAHVDRHDSLLLTETERLVGEPQGSRSKR